MKKGFIKGEVLWLLRTYSSQTTFEKMSKNVENSLTERGYPAAIVRKYPSEVKFADKKAAQRNKSAHKKKTTFHYTKSIPPGVT